MKMFIHYLSMTPVLRKPFLQDLLVILKRPLQNIEETGKSSTNDCMDIVTTITRLQWVNIEHMFCICL